MKPTEKQGEWEAVEHKIDPLFFSNLPPAYFGNFLNMLETA
jgi:hypothetical protein